VLSPSSFPDSDNVELVLPGLYDPGLAALAVAVAVFSSWLALQLFSRSAGEARSPSRLLAHCASSAALGCGMWAVHIIGLLAMDLHGQLRFQPVLTFASMLPSLLASFVALSVLRERRGEPVGLAGCGLLLGIGIATMHYAGLASARTSLTVHHDIAAVAASVGVAGLLAALALAIVHRPLPGLRRLPAPARLLAAAVTMGAAIVGMYVIGMAGADFHRLPEPPGPGEAGKGFVGVAIAAVAIAFTALAAAANALLRFREVFRVLSEKEAWHRALLDTAVDGVITYDIDGRITECNPSAERIFGWSRAELTGRGIGTLIPVGDSTRIELRRLVEHPEPVGSGVTREVQGLRKDGASVPLRVATGHVQLHGRDHFVAFISDIGTRKAIEGALRESELLMRSLVRNMPGLAYRSHAGVERDIVFISEAAERLTGYPPADFLGGPSRRRLIDLVHPEDRQRVQATLLGAIAKAGTFSFEYRLCHRNGSECWVWSNGAVVPGADGRPQWVDGVILDIAERKRSELEIRKYGALVASSDDAIMSKTLDGLITSWNPGSEKLFGYTEAEVIGRPMLLLFPDDRREEEAKILARIARGEKVDNVDTVRRRKDGRLVDVSVTISPIHDSAGVVVGASNIARDITERRHMEVALREAKDRAERAAEARSAFLANMSHEIRTPMNSILGFTDVLLQGELTAEQRRHLETVHAAGDSLLRLLNEILDTAKLDKGAIELEDADFDLLALVDELSSSLGMGARKKGLALDVNYHAALPRRFRGDELRIRQVLTNLLSNAVKFTEQGRIELAIAPLAGRGGVHIEVRDTGIGIPAHRVGTIFDPFIQADASMSRRFGGTGLGTTISKRLVELMGGAISVESRVGEGSVFRVELPLAPAGTAAAPVTHAPPGAQLPPVRILMADDVPQNLELLSLHLGRLGHELAAATNGAQAAELAAAQRFDLILMDVQMPLVDGLQATRRIREHEAKTGAARVPVIALTASVLAEDRLAAREAGMDGFASKPIDLKLLMQEIARVLGLGGPTVERPEAAAAPLSVLDTAQGLERWMHRHEAYRRELQRFAHAHADLGALLLEGADRQDHGGLRSLVHRVRGSAGNLGLAQLADLLARAEEALAREAHAQADALLREAPQQLAAATATIESWLAADRLVRPTLPAPLDDAGVDAGALEALAESLARELRRGAIDDAALRRVMQALQGRADPRRLALLRRAIDDFDFDLAQQRLDALFATLAPAEAVGGRP
jgi:PAS domain S-box-containing protein